MEKLIDDFIQFKPNRSLSTNKQYAYRLNKLIKKDIKFDDLEQIKEYLDQFKSTTRSNIYTSLIEYHLMKNSDPDLIEELQKIHSATVEIYKEKQKDGIFLDSQKDNSINSSQLFGFIDLIDNMIHNEKWEKKKTHPAVDYLNLRLILQLLINHPSRNEYATLEIIKFNDYKKIKENTIPWYKNYLIWKGRPKKYFLHIADYKTFHNYGLKHTEITDPKLIRALDMNRLRNGLGPLFLLSSGNPMTNNTMSQLLIKYTRKHLGKSVSSTMIYKSLIQEISQHYKKALDDEDVENIQYFQEKLKKFSQSRGHSLDTQQKIYFKI